MSMTVITQQQMRELTRDEIIYSYSLRQCPNCNKLGHFYITPYDKEDTENELLKETCEACGYTEYIPN